jgi:hypothetical protein
MSNTKDFTVDEIKSKFGISSPLGLTIVCDEEITDQVAEKVIRNYLEFHLATEEKITAADSFWRKFHNYITDAKDDQKESKEFLEWNDALERLERCKKDFLEMKHSLGISVQHIEEAKAA